MHISSIAVALGAAASSLSAQPGSVPKIELSGGISHFAQYVSKDARTNQTGGTIELRLPRARGSAVELAYTVVPQATTTASSAPRLHVGRLGVSWASPLDGVGRVVLHRSLGGALLGVDAQTVDCGDFPVCDEWAPRDALLAAAAIGAGLRRQLGLHSAIRADGLAYLPIGTWQTDGWRSLVELRLVLSAAF